jgi:hypothetical protein
LVAWSIANRNLGGCGTAPDAGTLDNIDVIHWLVTSGNECVDVISEREPTVDILPV